MIMRSASCNIFSVITSRLESSVVIRPPRSLGNDAFDIYSRGTSVPDALVVCSLFYWAWWVSLSLLLSSMADSVTTAIYPPDSTRSTIDQMVDVTWRWHRGRHSHRFLIFHFRGSDDNLRQSVSRWMSRWRFSDEARTHRRQISAADRHTVAVSSPKDVTFLLTWQPVWKKTSL